MSVHKKIGCPIRPVSGLTLNSYVLSRTTGYLFNFPAFYERGENLVTYKGCTCKLY